jgi:hypothetical protein
MAVSIADVDGCVWQLTNDLHMSGSHRQYLFRVSQGFERNAMVGFRCMKDGERVDR